MARIRSVHPGLFTDEGFMAASAHARILIIGLWTECDDQGVFEWKPFTLKARILPNDNIDMVALLSELEGLNFLKRFESSGKVLAAIRNFRKYQSPKKPKHVYELPEELRDYVGRDEEEKDPTHLLRKRKCEEQGGRCFYCATEITHYAKRYNSLDIDHVVPRSRGGSDDESNLVAACRTCNRGKGDMTGDEFRVALASRIEKLAQKSRAKSSVANASGELAPQMEDGGWRMEEGREETTSALELTSANPPAEEKPADAVALPSPGRLSPENAQAEALHRACLEAGDGAINPTSPAILMFRDQIRWLRDGCDPELDVLPTIRALADKRRRQAKPLLQSWAWFDQAIVEARDARMRPMPRGQPGGAAQQGDKLLEAAENLRKLVKRAG